MSDLKKKIEAILFSAGRTVLLKELQSLLHIKEPGLIKEMIMELKQDYESQESPMMILVEGEGWKLTIREGFLPLVQKINPYTELSKTILETLSVIAWKQPVLQSDVIKVRTNKAYDHVAELERLGFISKERHGRSFMLKVTQKFLDYFDLPDTEEIKKVFKEFKDIEIAVKKKVGDIGKEKGELEGEEMKKETKKEEEGVKEEKVELESYIDVPPPMKKPKKGAELEVYDVPPERIQEEEAEGKEEEKEKVEKPEKAEEKPEKKETPEEKAKRLAEELIGEEPVKTPVAESEEERKLHPQLEEFIEKSAERLGPKKQAKEEGKKGEKKKEEPEKSESEKEPEKPAPEKETEAEEPEKEKKKMVEEYPGQFSKSEEGEKGEEKEKKQE